MKIKLILALFLLALLAIQACNSKSETNASQSSEGESSDTTSQKIYIEKGKTIATATFASLSGKLQQSMAEGGVPSSLKYCNLAAMPLVDSLSQIHQTKIRRTSLKVRNPKNAPSKSEQEVLMMYTKQIKNGELPAPVVRQIDPQTVAFFAPIKVNDFCLQCHGKIGETLSLDNYEVIQQLYPEDKAIGYVAGDLRGIWSIEFFEK